MNKHVVVIGGGFSGLASAYELTKRGISVTVLEKDGDVGGLAGSFTVGETRLEKFYHHWFTNDLYIMDIINELGLDNEILLRPTRTGMYFSNEFFRLSTPLDLLQFTPLGFLDRLRLGLLALRARRVTDWRKLEEMTAEEWLLSMGGKKVYKVVWEPLLRGKFGDVAKEISAVWFWNKLKLRGGSRDKGGAEKLAYFRGGFAALAENISATIIRNGGAIVLNSPVVSLEVNAERVTKVHCADCAYDADAVISTLPLPLTADLLKGHVEEEYLNKLNRIRYLANVCLVLELDRSLSDTYWLNVNDPGFPFVGVIEHTNFEPSDSYGGRHIVYLSKYLPETDPLFAMSNEELLEYCVPFLQRMFPEFSRSWVTNSHTWRAQFSQPIVEKRYSALIPDVATPVKGFFINSMAQIYPEDRGTNYAIREGRSMGRQVASYLL